MTTPTDEEVTYPDVVIAVAMEIYGRRDEQKFGGNRRWRQLVAEFPALAEAARPPAPRNPGGRPKSELDHWRDEEERTHRHMEAWARSQTAARSPYYYRGGRPSVMKDAGSTSPGWCTPYGSWHHTDRGRWRRSGGAGPDQTTLADEHIGDLVRGQDLRTLHVETGGNYAIEGDGTRDNLLEVCRLCGTPLELPRNEVGRVIRGPGDQPEYCSTACRREVKNARNRAKRSEVSPRRRRVRPLPDLSVVHLAALGQLCASPAEWNRLLPRSGGQAAFDRLPAVRFVGAVLDRPRLAADRRASRCTRVGLAADQIARRYGTGGQPPSPQLAPGWDRVVTHWRYIERKREAGLLTREASGVWRIQK